MAKLLCKSKKKSKTKHKNENVKNDPLGMMDNGLVKFEQLCESFAIKSSKLIMDNFLVQFS